MSDITPGAEIDAVLELDPTQESSSMERLLELALMAKLTQEAWFGRRQLIDVLHSRVDAFGHDVVLERGTWFATFRSRAASSPESRAATP